MESQTGEWRTIRHDAIARVMTEFVVEAGFRTKWQPSWLPGMPPERKGDILVFDYPSKRRTHTGIRCHMRWALHLHTRLEPHP
jgi:hypothetical protein